MLWAMWVPAWLILVFSTVHVYHCTVDDVPTYSDRPCPDAVTLPIEAPTPVAFTPLDADQQRALKALDARLAKGAAVRAQRRARTRQRRERDRAASVKTCNSAMAALSRLDAQRRKGYRLKDAAKLAAAEAQHVEEVRRHCR
jgi:hypothetical protein